MTILSGERHSLLLLCLVLLCTIVKQLLVHFHEELQGIVDQSMDCPATQRKMVLRRPEPAIGGTAQSAWSRVSLHCHLQLLFLISNLCT